MCQQCAGCAGKHWAPGAHPAQCSSHEHPSGHMKLLGFGALARGRTRYITNMLREIQYKAGNDSKCLHSTYSPKSELSVPNNSDCNTLRWRSGNARVCRWVREGWALLPLKGEAELKPQQMLCHRELSPSKAGIVVCKGKGRGWPGLALQ